MKIAIIYSPQHRKLEQTAKNLGRFLESSGHLIEYLPISNQDKRPPSLRKYDYIYLGSIMEGTFGGKVPAEVSDFIRQCRGIENSKSAAFTLKRMFGNNKGLKRLMGVLESMGSQVMDFQVISGQADVEALGKRLQV